MSDEAKREELQRRLDIAVREEAAWANSKYGAENAKLAALLVESLRAELAALK